MTTLFPRRATRRLVLIVVLSASVMRAPTRAAQPVPAPVTKEEAAEIAMEAYIFAYPMVLAEITRRVATSPGVGDTADRFTPMNRFSHRRAFPDASFTNVVRPNADTLYSALWYDVSAEPLVISVPDSQGRYYLLPMLDMWTDVFASPGKRTTGTQAQTLLLAGPNWSGNVPNGMRLYRSPTPIGWLIGRTQTNGPADFQNVHRFQDDLTVTPLSAWGKNVTWSQPARPAPISKEPPVEQVGKMNAATFFGLFAELFKSNPPHANDYPILERMERVGIRRGQPFDIASARAEVRQALEDAVPVAQQKIAATIREAGSWVNHWRMVTPPVGTYGTDYLRRAGTAYFGMGANVIEDSLYFTGFSDSDDRDLDSTRRYVVQFAKDQLPPVRAFWSLTVYNERQFFAANPINRYAIGDRDQLKFNADGSLTVYVQRDAPDLERESNWLPAPESGSFTLSLRLYWPLPSAIEGHWTPPTVRQQP